MNWPFRDLKAKAYSVVVIDPPWRFVGGTASRPQHYRRMTVAQVRALPVRELLAPERGGYEASTFESLSAPQREAA